MADDKNSQDNSNANNPSSEADLKRLSDDTQPGDASQASSAPATVEELTEQLAKVRNEFLYLYAEFENYKKNAIKERADMRKYGSERLVVDILGVLDIFDTALALENTPENMAQFRTGIEMTAQEFRSALQKNGIEEMPSLGAAFDPNFHEALSSEETADLPPGHVSRVFKKPYKLHDRVVRPGQVIVAKAKS